MHSVPLQKRKVFDGVQVPTLREVLRRKLVQRAETSKNTLNTRLARVSIPKAPSLRGTRREVWSPTSSSPPSTGSDEGDLDWENLRVDDVTSSGKCNFCIELDIRSPSLLYPEADVEHSLANAHPSPPPQTRTFTPYSTPEYCHATHLAQRYYQNSMMGSIFPLDQAHRRRCRKARDLHHLPSVRLYEGPRLHHQGLTPCATFTPPSRTARLRYPFLNSSRQQSWSTKLAQC